MDKILITQFRDEIANAILNAQEKLNPTNDAYIDKDELQGVLDFFGVKDVSALLKTNNDNQSSIFEENEEVAEQDVGMDKLEIASSLINSDDALTNNNHAAARLHNMIAADVSTASAGTPYEAQIKELRKIKKELIKKGEGTTEIDARIQAINNAVGDYIAASNKRRIQGIVQNETLTTFRYGKDKENTGILIQGISFKGNNNYKNTEDSTPETDENQQEGNDEKSNDDIKSQANGGIIYNAEVITSKFHGIASIDASTDNSDIVVSADYNTSLKNGGVLNLSGDLRTTIEKNNNVGTYGVAIDYSKNKFIAGAYGYYNNRENDGTSEKQTFIEAFGQYKSIGMSMGIDINDDDKYYYAKVNGRGKREIPKSNLTLTGNFSTEFGVIKPRDEEEKSTGYLQVNAGGGISFKSEKIQANLSGDLKVMNELNLPGREKKEHLFSSYIATVLGSISTKNIDVITTFSATKGKENTYFDDDKIIRESRTALSSSITLALKRVFGKNVVPSITYNVNNEDHDINHNIGFNVGIDF